MITQRLDKASNSGWARTVMIPENVCNFRGAQYSKKCLLQEIPEATCPILYPLLIQTQKTSKTKVIGKNVRS